MINKAIDISSEIGWDTITDLELAHRFIEEKQLENDFVKFLEGIKKQDQDWLDREDRHPMSES